MDTSLRKQIASLTTLVQGRNVNTRPCIEIVDELIGLLEKAGLQGRLHRALLVRVPWDLPNYAYHLHMVCVVIDGPRVVVADPFPGHPTALLFGSTRNGWRKTEDVFVSAPWGTIIYKILSPEAIATIYRLNATTEATLIPELWQLYYTLLVADLPSHAARALLRLLMERGVEDAYDPLVRILETSCLLRSYATFFPEPYRAQLYAMHTGIQARKKVMLVE